MFIFEKNIKIHLQLIDVILEYLNTGYRWENNYSLSVNIPISINISLKPIYEVYYLWIRSDNLDFIDNLLTKINAEIHIAMIYLILPSNILIELKLYVLFSQEKCLLVCKATSPGYRGL